MEFLEKEEFLSFAISCGLEEKKQKSAERFLKKVSNKNREFFVLPDGKKHGREEMFTNGKLTKIINQWFGKKRGKETKFKDGKVIKITNWKNGKKHGKEIMFDELSVMDFLTMERNKYSCQRTTNWFEGEIKTRRTTVSKKSYLAVSNMVFSGGKMEKQTITISSKGKTVVLSSIDEVIENIKEYKLKLYKMRYYNPSNLPPYVKKFLEDNEVWKRTSEMCWYLSDKHI